MKKYDIKNIIEEIFKRQGDILLNIDRESIDVYLFLKKEYKKGNINNNPLFQFVFRSFYRLDNAGLTNEFKKHYFKLLSEKNNNLESILVDLNRFKNKKGQKNIQFSFTTKLLHTIDNNNPISDTEVLRVFHKNIYGVGREKIKSCLNIYEFLRDSYLELLQDSQTNEVILKFRDKFKVNKNEISDIKILDFIIWSLGKLKKVDK